MNANDLLDVLPIRLSNLYCQSQEFAFINCKLESDVLKHKWYVWVSTTGKRYARANINDGTRAGKTLYLHQLVFSLLNPFLTKQKNFDIDHIDTNGLNNLENNLRYIPKSENCRRGHTIKNKLHNIIKERDRPKPYRVYFAIKQKRINVGSYLSLDEALIARDKFIVDNNLIVF